jgi:NAD(P)-dependent dehydrogenase (short-subunit alcohol dehydrogenase family)
MAEEITASARFAGKVLFVTGGGSGLGEATARRFAAEGAAVAVLDLDQPNAERVAAELPKAIALSADVRDEAAVAAAVATTEAELGGIDVVFDNAGIDGLQQPAHETELSNWEAVRGVNGDGMFIVLKHGIDALLRRGEGSVVITSSASALRARPRISAYTFAKAGIVGLVRSTAVEYADRNIRINAVAPSAIYTPLVERFISRSADPTATRQRMETQNPIQGTPTPADVAAAVAFLSSSDAAWITGHTLPIDGGATIR